MNEQNAQAQKTIYNKIKSMPSKSSPAPTLWFRQ